MLKEYKDVRQIEGESRRRWFSDDYFDLIVWCNDHNQIIGFQLCYDTAKSHRALTWWEEGGYTHHRVDDGENRPGKIKATPILVTDGVFEYAAIAAKFHQAAQQLDPPLMTFIYTKLMEYPA